MFYHNEHNIENFQFSKLENYAIGNISAKEVQLLKKYTLSKTVKPQNPSFSPSTQLTLKKN